MIADPVELMVVTETFLLPRQGLCLAPLFQWPAGGWRNRSEMVEVIRPDGSRFEASANLWAVHFNIRDLTVPPERRWAVQLLLPDVAKADVPIGSRVMAPGELSGILVAQDA